MRLLSAATKKWTAVDQRILVDAASLGELCTVLHRALMNLGLVDATSTSVVIDSVFESDEEEWLPVAVFQDIPQTARLRLRVLTEPYLRACQEGVRLCQEGGEAGEFLHESWRGFLDKQQIGSLSAGLASSGVADGMAPSDIADGMAPSGIADGMVPSGIADGMAPSGIADGMAPSGIADGMAPSGTCDCLEGCSAPSGPSPTPMCHFSASPANSIADGPADILELAAALHCEMSSDSSVSSVTNGEPWLPLCCREQWLSAVAVGSDCWQ